MALSIEKNTILLPHSASAVAPFTDVPLKEPHRNSPTMIQLPSEASSCLIQSSVRLAITLICGWLMVLLSYNYLFAVVVLQSLKHTMSTWLPLCHTSQMVDNQYRTVPPRLLNMLLKWLTPTSVNMITAHCPSLWQLLRTCFILMLPQPHKHLWWSIKLILATPHQ